MSSTFQKQRDAALALEKRRRADTEEKMRDEQLTLADIIEVQQKTVAELKLDMVAFKEWKDDFEHQQERKEEFLRPSEIHEVICDNCDELIVGHRFKCLVCEDFDLCYKCESVGKHSEHAMLRVAHPKRTQVPGFIIFGQREEMIRNMKNKKYEDLRQTERTRLTKMCRRVIGGNSEDAISPLIAEIVRKTLEATEEQRRRLQFAKKTYDDLMFNAIKKELSTYADRHEPSDLLEIFRECGDNGEREREFEKNDKNERKQQQEKQQRIAEEVEKERKKRKEEEKEKERKRKDEEKERKRKKIKENVEKAIKKREEKEERERKEREEEELRVRNMSNLTIGKYDDSDPELEIVGVEELANYQEEEEELHTAVAPTPEPIYAQEAEEWQNEQMGRK